MKRLPLFCLVNLLLLFLSASNSHAQSLVFKSGEGGYASYRIPAIIKAPGGDLLSFCEGRVNNAGDFGNIDIVMKRSLDGGATWSSLQIVVDADSLQAGNPAPVVDWLDPNYPGGRIFLFYNTGNNHEGEVRRGKGERMVWYITSTDNGKTWSAPVDISSQVHRHGTTDDWRSYANTPGHALQLTRGVYAGRLFVPANHSEGAPKNRFEDYRAHAFYSDDHGKSFVLSQSVSVPGGNESIAAELSNNQVLLNSRNQRGDKKERLISISKNGGESWDTTFFDAALVDPVCQGSVLNIGWRKNKAVLAFSNAASQSKRDSLTVRISLNEGGTWNHSLLIDNNQTGRKGDYTAYSDLVLLNKKKLGVLYERNGYKEIIFQPLSIKSKYQLWKK
jgi:sialidase-1